MNKTYFLIRLLVCLAEVSPVLQKYHRRENLQQNMPQKNTRPTCITNLPFIRNSWELSLTYSTICNESRIHNWQVFLCVVNATDYIAAYFCIMTHQHQQCWHWQNFGRNSQRKTTPKSRPIKQNQSVTSILLIFCSVNNHAIPNSVTNFKRTNEIYAFSTSRPLQPPVSFPYFSFRN